MSNKSKVISLIAIVVVATSIFLSTVVIGNTSAIATEDKKHHIVTVQGEGTVKVSPDIAYISIGVETNHKDSKIAQKENSGRMNAVMSELKRLGLKDDDIKTMNYSISPDYRWENDKNVLNGYRVSNIAQVTIRNIEDCGKILDAVAQKDANCVYGVQFSVSDTEKAYKDALLVALKNAKEKAEFMTGYFGFEHIYPISIVENSIGGYHLQKYNSVSAMDTVASTPINPGQMEISASITVEFDMGVPVMN